MRILKIVIILSVFTIFGCGSSNSSKTKYTFTGTTLSNDIKSFQVNNFSNNAKITEPGIERIFTLRLQDLIKNQTQLNLENKGGDLVYEGEITEYSVAAMTATANQRAAQSRLTITVNVRFVNKKNEKTNFEKKFSFYHDFDQNKTLTGSTLHTALDEIFEYITQDIFNESLAKW